MDATPPQARPSPAQVLRAHARGLLLANDLALQVRYVVDPATGDPVLSLSPETVEAGEWVLCIPEEADDALRLSGTSVVLDPAKDPACDRWIGYHGTPDQSFFRLTVAWARLGVEVFDAPEVREPSTLRRAEVALVKILNAKIGALGPGVRAVGVDQRGIDLRTHRGLVRIPFEIAATDAEDAAKKIEELLREDKHEAKP